MSTAIPNAINVSGPPATIDDLYRVDGKAELIGGRIVRYMPTGDLPNYVAFQIAIALNEYAKRTASGIVRTDNIAYTLPRPLKKRPAVVFSRRLLPSGVRALPIRCASSKARPTFAVEVRSEGDYTPAAVREMAAKRNDYFEAGTLAVWDVDPLARTITLYLADAPTQSIAFASGQIAHAEPAVPGWTALVDDVIPLPS